MQEKFSKNVHMQMIGYAGVALIGLIADFATVFICKEFLNFYYLLAVCAGFIVGLIVTFILSNWAIFGTPKMDIRVSFILFGVIGLIGLLILNALVWFFTDILGIYYLLSKAIATVFVFFWNFFARRKLYH